MLARQVPEVPPEVFGVGTVLTAQVGLPAWE
jgi:hypothetical protein